MICIGFADPLFPGLESYNFTNIWEYEPGSVPGSWGYRNNGLICAHDNIGLPQYGLPYGAGAIVGCCFDRISRTVSFTLDGLRSGRLLSYQLLQVFFLRLIKVHRLGVLWGNFFL